MDAELMQKLEAEWAATRPENRLLVERLSKESPRGIILIVGAYAEEAVETLLRAACVKTGKALENLLGHGSAPLGSFSARIAACWCFGLLPEDEYVNLEQLRKLRNYVAHNLETVDFNDPKVNAHIANLRVENLGTDEPVARLSYFVGTLRSWVNLAVPHIKAHMLPRVLSYAAADAVAESKDRPPPTWDDLEGLVDDEPQQA